MVHLRLIVLTIAAAATCVTLAAEPKKPAAKPAAKSASSATTAAAEKVRDWRAIDTNKDNLISPEEMEAWLKANQGPDK